MRFANFILSDRELVTLHVQNWNWNSSYVWYSYNKVSTKKVEHAQKRSNNNVKIQEVIFKSISPRLKESAHMPDLTWKAPFFISGFDSDIEVGSSFVGDLLMDLVALALGGSACEVQSSKLSSSKGL